MAPRALPGNLGCPPWTPRRTEGQQPQSSAQAGIAQVRRDASRLHHSVGIQRGYLCRRGCIVAPLHSQGYSTVTSARPHTVFYAVPFFTFKQDGDASRLPPLTWGYIVAASVCFKARISYKIASKLPFVSACAQYRNCITESHGHPHTEEVEAATRCTRPRCCKPGRVVCLETREQIRLECLDK